MSKLMMDILFGVIIAESLVMVFSLIWLTFCLSNLIDKVSESIGHINHFYVIYRDDVTNYLLSILRNRTLR